VIAFYRREKNRSSQSTKFKEAPPNPKLGGEIGTISWENTHPFIGQGVEKVNDHHSPIKKTQTLEKKVSIEFQSSESKKEHGKPSQDRQKFHDGMEQKVVGTDKEKEEEPTPTHNTDVHEEALPKHLLLHSLNERE